MAEWLERAFDLPWAWMIGGLVLAGLEIVAPGAFLLWIGLGAIATGLLLFAMPDLSLQWQLMVFAGAMLASVGLGAAIQLRGRGSDAAAGINVREKALLGRTFMAVQDFEAGQGRIRVGDGTWIATASAPIRAGQTVRVMAVEKGVAQVEPMP